MNKNKLLECCVDSVSSAIIAEQSGADRLELCANLVIGGTTPPLSLFQAVKKAVTLPVHVLLRPRFGDFLYDRYEQDMLLSDVLLFAKEGADGIVIGSLRSDGSLDCAFLEKLLVHAKSMHRTLHRAFDMCPDAQQALLEASALGFDTILTSGLSNTALEGMETLQFLSEQAEKLGITIMAGAGIDAAAIQTLLETTALYAFHMSGKRSLDSSMVYRRPSVSMGLPGLSEYTIYQTNPKAVQRASEVLHQ